MTSSKFKQLNPFELKSALTNLLEKINSVQDVQNCIADFEMLDAQEDKTVLAKLLFKELVNAKVEKISIICFLLERYVPKEEMINKLWETLKNQNLQSEVKITILNLLRELDADWSYETCEEYLGDAEDILDENTKQMLNSAIINPEVQIDFMDFLASIKVQDKITLLNSFGQDFSDDALANILIPVFESEPNSATGKEALRLLGETKSQLALHVLQEMTKNANGELAQLLKKSLSTLKISGIREDNTKEFYSSCLRFGTQISFRDFLCIRPRSGTPSAIALPSTALSPLSSFLLLAPPFSLPQFFPLISLPTLLSLRFSMYPLLHRLTSRLVPRKLCAHSK